MTEPINPGTISPLPVTPPSLNDPANFDVRGDAVIGHLPTLITEVNSVTAKTKQNADAAKEKAEAAEQSKSDATDEAERARDEAILALGYRNQAGAHATTATQQAGIATDKAGIATTKAGEASASAGQAEQSVSDAAGEANRSRDEADRAREAADSVAGGPILSVNVHSGLKTGAVTLALSDMGAQATDAQMQAGTATEPMLMSPANVRAAALANSRVQRVARTANTQLITTDSGKWIDITAGTFTQTFLAPAALGTGWWCYLQNSGTGDITIPSSDGLTNWIMYPNEVRLFQCDGVALRSIVLVGFRRTFTSSDSLIRPPGYKEVLGIGWDGGQGGGVNGYGSPVQGGVGASLKEYRVGPENTKTELAIVIGSGGLGSTDTNTGGKNPGGITTLDGQIGVLSSRSDAALYKAGNGGDSNYGGATAKLGFASTYAGNGGDGGYGTAAGAITNGQSGNAPGGGGGSTSDNGWLPRSGDGARGELRTWGGK